MRDRLVTIGIELADLVRPATRWMVTVEPSRPADRPAARHLRLARDRLRAGWAWVRRHGDGRWRHIGAVAASVLTLLALSLTWFPDDTSAGTVPSSSQTVGTCHLVENTADREAFSHVRAPVACDRPHQAETAHVADLPADLASTPGRMTPEKRVKVTNDLCSEPVRGYLGARPRDGLHAVQITLRLPTAAEWDAGLRQYRCEVRPGRDGDLARPETVSTSMRDILTQSSGAAFRRCWADFVTEISCDRPHLSESVNAIAPLPAGREARPSTWFTPADVLAFRAWANPICRATVSEFLGAPVHTTPYRPVAHLTRDGSVVECGVAHRAGRPPAGGSLAPVRSKETR